MAATQEGGGHARWRECVEQAARALEHWKAADLAPPLRSLQARKKYCYPYTQKFVASASACMLGPSAIAIGAAGNRCAGACIVIIIAGTGAQENSRAHVYLSEARRPKGPEAGQGMGTATGTGASCSTRLVVVKRVKIVDERCPRPLPRSCTTAAAATAAPTAPAAAASPGARPGTLGCSVRPSE